MRARLQKACGHPLDDAQINRLAVLAGLHDLGKSLAGFQERIRSNGSVTHIHTVNGHVVEALAALLVQKNIQEGVHLPELTRWFSDPAAALFSSICHHGGPAQRSDIQSAIAYVQRNIGQHTLADIDELFSELSRVFPPGEGDPIQFTPSFQHLFAGVVMLADWMGSSLPTGGDDDRPGTVAAILDEALSWSDWHSGAAYDAVLHGRKPIGAQTAIGRLPLTERLVTVEAPTGTGKTEAAMLWASRLVEQGLVDGMYFAVPLRSAAVELHARVSQLAHHHPALSGRILRAVPGQMDTDPWQGLRSWALGSTKKAMSAPVAVGTIDQALLTVLRNRHAWMRHAALSRQLLVIDEVHASDAYMAAITARLIGRHLDLGGYVMTMSATLGEFARAKFEGRPARDMATAVTDGYPVVRTSKEVLSITAPPRSFDVHLVAEGKDIAREAIEAGDTVLWIHATVEAAIRSWEWAQELSLPSMLHHSRYADVDRRALDAKILEVIGKSGSRTPLLICATQTVEQSLDIDADVLITTPCPGDVLLQRCGRVGRHRSGVFPVYYLQPDDIGSILSSAIRAASGRPVRLPEDYDWAYIYSPLAISETVEFIRDHPRLDVIAHSRELVERCSHQGYLEEVARAKGAQWPELWRATYGTAIAGQQQGVAGVIDWSRSYAEAICGTKVPSRLGEMAITINLDRPVPAAFGSQRIDAIAIPSRWLSDVPLTPDSVLTVGETVSDETILQIGGATFKYGLAGLGRF